MRNKTIIKWGGIVVVLLLLMQTATQAALLLPKSSLWHGGNQYTRNGITAYVEYAVYDSGPTGNISFPTALTLPSSIETARYLYAYKILNVSNATIGTFQIIAKNVSNKEGIGSIADGADGIVPDTSSYADKIFQWEFGGGLFVIDKQSAYLVFTSDYAPVEASNLNFSSNFGNNPGLPGTESEVSESLENSIPEPATLALLSIGALTLRKKLRRS
ncbi:MAG: PEP-CTERM sorting domain-containing protein [Phycisphaerales bacterium]